MGFQFLILTCDPSLLSDVQTSLGSQGIQFQLRQDSTSAIELASRRHLDGLMIDCDDVPGGAEALGQIRNTPANKQTYILAIVNGSTGTRAAIALGANFVLSKPIQQTLLGILPVAITDMEREHRRYFRYDVDLPVWFQNALGQSCTARMKNVSESGLAIKPVDPVGLRGRIKVKFELPSIQPQTFQAKADVVWSDS